MAIHTANDGTRLFYRARGSGAATFVFVHGWCSRADHWPSQLRSFARSHRVLAVDRRGHGRSDAPRSGYTAARHAQDLEEILAREGVHDAILVAHAGGVPATLALAVDAPARARALVLIDSRVGPRADLDDPNDPAGAAYRGMVDAIRGPRGEQALREMYSELFSPHAGEVAPVAIREALETPLEVAADELSSLAIDTLTLARRIEQPVLWLTAGGADEPALREAFRNIQFGQVVGSGHFPQLEVPDQTNAMIARFVATL